MAYPLIILGAGASYDFSAHKKKPPLTRDLVRGEYLDQGLLEKYDGAAEILSEISSITDNKSCTFEEAIDLIKKRSDGAPHRAGQLIDLQYYLRDRFTKVSEDSFFPLNNHKTLINKIKDIGGRACIVSFNYDSLFEKSLGRDKIVNIDSYINSDIKIIKLHGSHDWAYISGKSNIDLGWGGYQDSRDFLKKNPDYFENKRKHRGEISPYHVSQLGLNDYYDFPAIAVPLSEKQDFICPPKHIKVLKEELEKVDRILVIGWKAGDAGLLDIIKDTVMIKNIPVFLVVGPGDFEEVRGNLIKFIPHENIIGSHETFSNFVGDEKFDNFFK